MIQDFFDQHVFLYIMGGLCVFGVVLKCFLLVIYNKLIKASECMTNTKKQWLKNMRIRFESSYQLQLGVNDVDTYVDKYVSRIKSGGLLLSTWENISGQTIGLCLLTGSFAGILGFVYDCGQGTVLFTFFSGAWTAIIVNIVDNVVNISAHKQMLRYNLIDYFENNLKVRMEQEIFHSEARRQYHRQYFDDTKDVRQEAAVSICKESSANMDKEEDLGHLSKMCRENDKEEEKVKEEKKVKEKEVIEQAEIERKVSKKQEKIDAKNHKKQSKLDAKAAKKKEKKDLKQIKLDAMQARKQAKLDKKQQLVEAKREKKQEREEKKVAKEKAIIEEMLAKKNARELEKEEKEKQRKEVLLQRDHMEKERKQKDLESNKAYKEKMRLKQEKEREAARRKEEEQLLEKAKEQEIKQKEEAAMADRLEIESEEKEFGDLEDAESIAMASTSNEENILIEEVLKDFLF